GFVWGHGCLGPGFIEVAHLVSPLRRPDLAWSRDNLAPPHGPRKKAINKRCPDNSCNLACNYLAAIAPDAPKDESGADLPFTEEFKTRQAARNGGKARNSGKSPAIPAPPAGAPAGGLSPGRPW